MEKTVIADLDGTIIRRWTASDKTPRVNVAFHCDAIVSNQGGVAMRFAGIEEAKKYPSFSETVERVRYGLRVTNARFAVMVCYHRKQLKTLSGVLMALRGIFTAPELVERGIYISYNPFFRKPKPGALLYTAKYLNALPCDCIYVGDEDGDCEAAMNAGMDFVNINEPIALDGNGYPTGEQWETF